MEIEITNFGTTKKYILVSHINSNIVVYEPINTIFDRNIQMYLSEMH